MKPSLSVTVAGEKDVVDGHIEDDVLSVLLQQLAFGRPNGESVDAFDSSLCRHSVSNKGIQLPVSSLELKSDGHVTVEGENQDNYPSISMDGIRHPMNSQPRLYYSSSTETCEMLSVQGTSQTGAETQSEETFCEQHYSIQFVRDSIDNALTTLYTPRSSCSTDDDDLMYAYTHNIEMDHLDLDDCISERSSYSPLEIPFFSIITTDHHTPETSHSYTAQQQEQSPVSHFSDFLFDQVETTLQNMESIIDHIVLNRGENIDTILQENNNIIMHHAQIEAELRAYIHQLQEELVKAREDSFALTTKVQSLEKSLNDKLEQERVATNECRILQDTIQRNNEQVLELTTTHDLLKMELHNTRIQVQTLTMNQTAYHDRDMMTQVTVSSLQNILKENDVELETLRKTLETLNESKEPMMQVNLCPCQSYRSTVEQERMIVSLSSKKECTMQEKQRNDSLVESMLPQIPDHDTAQSPSPKVQHDQVYTLQTEYIVKDSSTPDIANHIHTVFCPSEALAETDSDLVQFDSSYPSNKKCESHSKDDDALMMDAEHVIQKMELKILSLEKTVQAYRNQQKLENTHLLSDDNVDYLSPCRQANHGAAFHLETSYNRSLVDTRRLIHSMEEETLHIGTGQVSSSSSYQIDILPLMKELSLSSSPNNISPTRNLQVGEAIQRGGQDSYSRLSVLEADNCRKDQMIENLCEQICELKACLEELLESDRLYENEYKRQLIEAEEKCRMLLNERDALLDETLKLFQTTNSSSLLSFGQTTKYELG